MKIDLTEHEARLIMSALGCAGHECMSAASASMSIAEDDWLLRVTGLAKEYGTLASRIRNDIDKERGDEAARAEREE